MFGYIKPHKDELKVREFEQFKACYCALCHTLESEYGAVSRFILNYDFTFLAMLLWDEKDPPQYHCSRCVASPIRKKKHCRNNPSLKMCAGYSVILFWWKLKDTVKDERFFKSLRDRLLLLLLRRSYHKASRAFPEFEKSVRQNLNALSVLEKSGSSSLDACADKFARITGALSSEVKDSAKRRPLEQLLYHTGRYIYIVDACDDLKEDTAARRYNPIAARYHLMTGVLTDEARVALETTLKHSCGLIGTAYELLPRNDWSSIIENIIYLGMPEVTEKVLSGAGTAKCRLNIKGNGQ